MNRTPINSIPPLSAQECKARGFDGLDFVYISGDEAPRALYRPWTSGINDTNDKWITVTLPLKSNFIYGYKGGVATGKLTPESWSSLTMFLASGGVAGTPCTPVLKIDNIRVGKY